MADTSQPDVRAWPVRGGYNAHYRLPGGSWRFVTRKGTAAIFETSEAAKDAARTVVFRVLCPSIVSERSFDEDKATTSLAAEIANWKTTRAEERRQVQKTVMRRPGRKAIMIERRVGR